MKSFCLVSGEWPRSIDAASSAGCIVAEDAAAARRLEAAGIWRYRPLSDLVHTVRDAYDSSVVSEMRRFLPRLAEGLGAIDWNYRGVALWDVVVADFLWRCLDPAVQALDTARSLLAVTDAEKIHVLGSTPLTRALTAVASKKHVSVTVQHARRTRTSRSWSRCAPYAGHCRDLVSGRSSRRLRNAHPIVAVAHTERNLSVAAPVLAELSPRVGSERLVVLNTEREPLRMAGLQSKTRPTRGPDNAQDATVLDLRGFASAAGGFAALRAIAPLQRFLRSRAWRRNVERLGIEWDGVPVVDVIEPEVSDTLPRLLANAAREIDAACNMLESLEPAAILLTDDRTSVGRAIGLSARVCHVPTLMMQWGPIGHNAVWIPGVAADVALVEGERGAEVFGRSCNHAALEIEIAGQPRYEALEARAATVSRGDVCRQLGLNPDLPIVLYASPPVVEASASSRLTPVDQTLLHLEVRSVIETALAIAPAQLVVKPHPNEGAGVHREIANRVNATNLLVLEKDADIYPALFACDVVVTHHSTVGIEGVVLGKPLVIVNLTGRGDAMPYVREGVAIGAYGEADVATAISQALNDPHARDAMSRHRPAYLRRHACRGQIPAAERIASIVLERMGDLRVSRAVQSLTACVE